MEILGKEKLKPRVKVIVGRTEKGFKGIKKPMKSMTIIDVSVNEIYNKILKMLENEK